MTQTRYEQALDTIRKQGGDLSVRLPKEWPSTASRIDAASTLRSIRQAASTVNELIIAIGWGDGEALRLLSKDALNSRKQVHWILFPSERKELAHFLGTEDFECLGTFSKLHLHLPENINELTDLLRSAFPSHESISRLAGASILADHPLTPEALQERQSWLPIIQKTLVERFDCLGNDVYDTFMGAKHALMHGRRMVDCLRSADLHNAYKDIPAISLVSGPSAKQHLEHIRSIQNECIIIVADSYLAGALEAGIEPDFVTIVERPVDHYLVLKESVENTNATLVCLPVVHPNAVNLFPPERCVLWWNSDELYPWLDPKEPMMACGRSTGTMGVALAAMLGCESVYLVGHDLAFDADGRSYAAGVSAQATINDNKVYGGKAAWSYNDPNYYKRIFDVPRNGGGIIQARGVWEIFRGDVEAIIKIHTHAKFINLNISRGEGAVIAGAIAGNLPDPLGKPADKKLPNIKKERETWEAYKERALKVAEDWQTLSDKCVDLLDEVENWQPLAISSEEITRVTREFDIGTIVSPENASLFRYIFRAALRNCMVRLQQNTFVRTFAEKEWNQVLALRMFASTLKDLLASFKPELDQAMESYND